MTTITITVADLDRLTHALLIAKADYVSKSVLNLHGEQWRHAMRNIAALDCLYAQLVAAMELSETAAE